MEASMCKLFASEACGRVADRAVQVMGGAGYISGNVAERFYRDVRLFRLYEGTSQIHLLNIAKLMQSGRSGKVPPHPDDRESCAAGVLGQSNGRVG